MLVLNDFAIVTSGITAIFASRPDRFTVVALQGRSALGPAELASTDVVLFDPFASSRAMSDRMPEDAELGGTKWVVLTWNITAASVAAALELGCDGYLSKALDDRSLMSAVERISAGEKVVAITTPWPRTDTAGDWPGKEAGLSPRESEVLCLIAQGFTEPGDRGPRLHRQRVAQVLRPLRLPQDQRHAAQRGHHLVLPQRPRHRRSVT